MRAAKVPTRIAVTAEAVHYVVSTVNSCASYRAFRQRTSACATLDSASPSPLPPFRLALLLPADWSALLRMCRRVTHPGASFNFSSPGDMWGDHHHTSDSHHRDANARATAEGAAQTIQNNAFMHVVERVTDDFTPNNMIYHQLQKFHLLTADPADELQTQAPPSMVAFTQLVTAMQQQPPQSPQDVFAELLDSADTAQAAATVEQKRALDPLFSSAEAAAASKTNREQLRAYTAWLEQASQKGGGDGGAAGLPPPPSSPFVFVFSPHPVPAAVSIPYCSAHFCVMVNLKPIVPNHLMVVPIRCVGTIHGLTEEEVEDWGHVMRRTISVLDDLRQQQQLHPGSEDGQASGSPPSLGNYSIAIQQGALAGQTVEHLHVHVIPFDPRGKLAGEPETDEEEQRRRPPRTPAVMKAETDALRLLFAKHAATAAAAKDK
ncbi:hypothetical protein ABL78_7715 [Leptomonas seymouri]|uniref:HIT domain-containing protein n=1 Tax=Leptomonas seymouri TaxID=5684 RepID=A0A0N0P352_LEPSE|nr:hypothetical protein ABL78_7715 [Leptomonas seymouri]|eukprot:KPI83257.1 hypothetical protein ABL78_7715 [Leptomonas seymouri]